MREDSTKKNFAFQIAYQAIILVLPFIIAPIVSRRLGSEALGIYSYAGSIVYYFVVFANLGIMKYGQRAIATSKDNHIVLRKVFWSLFIVHIVISAISIIAYSVFVFFCTNEYTDIFWIYTLSIFSAMFDITWFFYGIQTFKSVVIKNLICRIAVTILIIFFVDNPSDLPLYTLIEVLALLVSNLALIPTAVKFVKPIKISFNDCLQHIRPLFILAIAVIAIALYTMFDKTLLGLLATKADVAFYEYSNKIITIPRTFVAVIGTVFFPKACSMSAKGDLKGKARYAEYAYIVLSLISFSSIFGLIAIGQSVVTIYYGAEFSACGKIIIAMSPLIFIIGLGDIVRNIFLIPQKKDLFYVVCLCLSAGINIILTAFLIPTFGVYGAVIGTTIAELFGLIMQIWYCRKEVNFISIMKSVLVFGGAGFLMFLLIASFSTVISETSIVSLLVMLFAGMSAFAVLSIFIIHIFYKDIWNKIVLFFKKRKKVV